VDIFGVRAKIWVCLPAPAGESESMLVFEMTVSPASTVSETSKVALSAGSSKQGKARRASVDSNWVTA